MKTISLTYENVGDYGAWIVPDMAENLDREYYRGLILEDDEDTPVAGMLYEILYNEEERPTEAAIRWLKIMDGSVAPALFEAYGKAAKDNGVSRTSFVIPVKDSAVEKAALKEAGFRVKLTEGNDIIVTLDELKALPIMKSTAVPDSIRPLNRINARAFRRAVSKCSMLGKKGVCEDLSYLPLSWFDPDVSCYSEEDGEVNGLMLFHKRPSGVVAIQLMIGLTSDPQMILLGMMRQFVISLEACYGPMVKVILDRHNQSSFKLSEKLLPRGFGIPVYAGDRDEE